MKNNGKFVAQKLRRNELYRDYLHNVVIPLAQIRKVCLACENYHLCGMNFKIDALIDKATMIMAEINQTDEEK